MELSEQRRLDSLAGLVAGPKAIAKRLDDMIGRRTEMRGSPLDHLQDAVQNADHCAERPVLALREAAQAVEVPEELICAVDEVDDHGSVTRSYGGESGINYTDRKNGRILSLVTFR
jgi:hypothetical protein